MAFVDINAATAALIGVLAASVLYGASSCYINTYLADHNVRIEVSSIRHFLLFLTRTKLHIFSIVVFFTCLYVILRRRAGGNGVPWWADTNSTFIRCNICRFWRFIFGGAILQFIVSTIHIGNCWRQLLEAFIWKANIPGASFAYFVEDPTKPTEIIAKTLVIVDVNAFPNV